MTIEIERKWLVDLDKIGARFFLDNGVSPPSAIKQGYLSRGDTTVRARLGHDLEYERAYLTIKGKSDGLSRSEFEYKIPMDDALLFEMCEGKLEKRRYVIPYAYQRIELDVFGGDLDGLVLAEVEFKTEDIEKHFIDPSWSSKEVTNDNRYANSKLTNFECKKSIGDENV